MWPANALTERLRLKWPIIQAPMGIMSTPALAAAVSNAGGLGGLGMWGLSADEAGRRIAGFRQQSGGSLNVNYPMWPEPVTSAEVVEQMRQFLQTHFYDNGFGTVPEPQGGGQQCQPRTPFDAAGRETRGRQLPLRPAGTGDRAGRQSCRHLHPVERDHCCRGAPARRAGGGAVITQGTEAGGHRATFTGIPMGQQAGLFSLLPQVVDAVRVPVIAAGGVADGRTAAAAFMLGASAVQLGTFLRCEEANMQDAHRAALAEANDSCTIVTDVISGRPARYIKNRLVDELVESGMKPLPIPAQLSLTMPLGESGDRTWQHSDEDLFQITKYGQFPGVQADTASAMPGSADKLDDHQILAALAFIKARWPLGLRVSQAMLNPSFAGMPHDADQVEWRLPPNCNVLLRRGAAAAIR